MASMPANPKQCVLVGKEIKYLGFSVRQGIIKPLMDRVETIHWFQPPWTRCQMQSFLELINYYRKFIPDFAELGVTLTLSLQERLTEMISWSPNILRSFEGLKVACAEMF